MIEKDTDYIRERRCALGASFKDARTAAGLSLRQLASLCDIHFTNLGKFESGQLNVQLDTLYRIARALNLDITVTKTNDNEIPSTEK